MATREFWADLKWGESHHTELLRSYEDQWVAIVDKKVISAGINLAEVQKKAKEKAGIKEIPTLFIDSGQFPFQQVL